MDAKPLKNGITNELIQDGLAAGIFYTHSQIVAAWGEYQAKKVMKVLKGGVWLIRDTGTKMEEGITEAAIVTCDKAMSFPRFLEKYNE